MSRAAAGRACPALRVDPALPRPPALDYDRFRHQSREPSTCAALREFGAKSSTHSVPTAQPITYASLYPVAATLPSRGARDHRASGTSAPAADARSDVGLPAAFLLFSMLSLARRIGALLLAVPRSPAGTIAAESPRVDKPAAEVRRASTIT